MTDDPRQQLEEMAQARLRGQQQLAEALRARDEMEPKWNAVCARVSNLTQAIKAITRGIETTRKAYAIKAKVDEMDIAYGGSMVVLAETHSEPEPWFLVAVGPEGTGLYIHRVRYRRRFGNTSYARTMRDGEQFVETKDVPDTPYDRSMSHEARMRLAEERAAKLLPQVRGSQGLLAKWETRGRGPFGAGSGPIKPKAPPEGGKWRWIRVDEQALLEVGAA